MTREWKVGDVAVEDGTDLVLYCYAKNDALRWKFRDGSHRSIRESYGVRPLVVIDPEDDAQVERLRFMISDLVSSDQLREALEHFANPTPPKPAEPTGLGAVVMDEDGSLLTRLGSNDWRAEGGHRFTWSEIDNPRVLSDGMERLADWELSLLRGES